jgi:phospholipase C
MTRSSIVFAVASAAVVFAAGCAGSASDTARGISFLPGSGLPGSARQTSGSSGQIQHVVIMIQENRSFDDFFATFPGATGATQGLMKLPSGDVYVPLKKAGLDSDSLGHQHFSFLKEYDNGKMDGFNLVERAISRGNKVPAGTYAYRYVAPWHIKPYWFIAQNYVLGDHMFTTQGSSSFTAHQDLIAGGTPVNGDNVIDFPNPATWGCNGKPGTTTNLITPSGNYLRGKGPFPCFSYETMRDLLDGAGLSWLYFTNPANSSYWNAFDAISAVREGPEWTTNIVVPETQIFNTISYGQLPAVTWVIPDAQTSDHPGDHVDKGPEWVASVVNAIGESQYWPSTVVIIVWDEWGGEYDNVPPPQLDGQGLGPRVPLLIVSAYDRETTGSQPGYISHTQYEDGSILKFIEENWGLPSLGTSDLRANSIGDSFDFTQAPRAFIPIPASYSIDYFKHYKASSAPIDEY